ncbi:uncharacterized protein LOC106155883 [Lingula anatina]|uniref:Uncharacterized protein LOC106155883 n=1 Tax=Lingula anatina TaxID=7574 RepID=A0A1S3HMT1_LINAN|nr:uncharacterized protein LOC106155883 [Lingula anatina]|eukprot:XP_013386364.1 uncharacterized protein LOC106155883 [Lingula anatina]
MVCTSTAPAILLLIVVTVTGMLAERSDREPRQVYRPQTSGYHYGKSCYQCSFGPRVKFHKEFGRIYYDEQGHEDPYSRRNNGIHSYEHHVRGGLTQFPGWVPCRGPFSHYDAEAYGINVWACSSNCYIRMDKNGHIYRGCYQGEWKVDPYRLGCHKQTDSLWCFCEGDRCNNGPLPGVRYEPRY